jgi:multisubunit Na+/H+ antiporter MnhB subunit
LAQRRGLQELVTVFKEVKQIVGEQGQDINKIEQNTVTADMNVAEGAKELEEGEKLQNSARKKKVAARLLGFVFLVLMLYLYPSISFYFLAFCGACCLLTNASFILLQIIIAVVVVVALIIVGLIIFLIIKFVVK